MFDCIKPSVVDQDVGFRVGSGWHKTSVIFRLMMRPKAVAAFAKQSTMRWSESSVCAVVCIQELERQLVINFRSCQQTPLVEDASVYSEADIDAISDVVLCLSDHDAEEKGE